MLLACPCFLELHVDFEVVLFSETMEALGNKESANQMLTVFG
jgi:hypothetical protein